MLNQKERTWNPVSFLEAWTDEHVGQQRPREKTVDNLGKKFLEDAAAQGVVLAQFMFNEASLAGNNGPAAAFPK